MLPPDDKDNRNSPLKTKVTTTMKTMRRRKMMIMALMIQMMAIVP